MEGLRCRPGRRSPALLTAVVPRRGAQRAGAGPLLAEPVSRRLGEGKGAEGRRRPAGALCGGKSVLDPIAKRGWLEELIAWAFSFFFFGGGGLSSLKIAWGLGLFCALPRGQVKACLQTEVQTQGDSGRGNIVLLPTRPVMLPRDGGHAGAESLGCLQPLGRNQRRQLHPLLPHALPRKGLSA